MSLNGNMAILAKPTKSQTQNPGVLVLKVVEVFKTIKAANGTALGSTWAQSLGHGPEIGSHWN